VVVETKSNLQFWNHVSEIGQREILFSLRGVVAKIAFSNTVLNDSSGRRARKFQEIPKSETTSSSDCYQKNLLQGRVSPMARDKERSFCYIFTNIMEGLALVPQATAVDIMALLTTSTGQNHNYNRGIEDKT
jgi:hypothetical protein